MINEKYEKAIEMYIEGKSIKNICNELHISNKKLSHLLESNNIKIRGYSSTKKVYSDEIIQNILLMHSKGTSIREISSILGISRSDVSHILKLSNIHVTQRKHEVDSTIFKKIDNEEKAYWLGFLYADGSVCIKNGNYTVSLGLQIIDIEHIKKFKKFCCTNSNIEIRELACSISTKCTKIKRKYAYIRINSKEMCDCLIGNGCIEKKSLILKFPSEDQVPKHLMKHFIRGYFDGDGCVYIDTNKRTKSLTKSIMFQIVGTYDFLLGVKEYYSIKSKITKHGNIYDLRCKGNIKALSIFDDMYADSNISLDRKYDIYYNFKENYINAVLDRDI